ncbi:MAG TPA: hypothetical protein PKL17_05965 [Pseudomonadota bacterium]|jgi:hypothetical protein|nr:hypothetical protein [Pseudomonadota bacterium]HNF95903.1 hypothetical protein [Pseudomonadota bacterium]HNI60206.1 hypothetical protein [Pseudomonadota bacterium]HNK44306.1 hypothetical protein [Pseudomonadota bacterium]HNN50264.1 hypothetical protein [Pseudomonadota bacterium]
MRAFRLWLLGPLIGLGFGGCGPSLADRVDALQQLLEAQSEQIQRLRLEIGDGIGMAMCTPELSQLIEDVQRECEAQTETCTTKQIRPAVIAADPEHKGRFLKLMSHLRHEVFYFRDGASQVIPFRAERLHKLLRSALLRNTQFLIVSSPDSGEQEAHRRARAMEQILVERGIPRAKIRRWVYAFPQLKEEVERSVDLPGLGETRDLHRGVWVFRSDC